jgi:hypothetical protein
LYAYNPETSEAKPKSLREEEEEPSILYPAVAYYKVHYYYSKQRLRLDVSD